MSAGFSKGVVEGAEGRVVVVHGGRFVLRGTAAIITLRQGRQRLDYISSSVGQTLVRPHQNATKPLPHQHQNGLSERESIPRRPAGPMVISPPSAPPLAPEGGALPGNISGCCKAPRDPSPAPDIIGDFIRDGKRPAPRPASEGEAGLAWQPCKRRFTPQSSPWTEPARNYPSSRVVFVPRRRGRRKRRLKGARDAPDMRLLPTPSPQVPSSLLLRSRVAWSSAPGRRNSPPPCWQVHQ